MSSTFITAELLDDTPYGIIKLSQKLNSSIAYRVPRSLLNEFSKIKEANFYGTYILINKVTRQAYIGRSEDLQNRIKQHHSSKDFWTEVFFVTSTTNELSLADIAYLEYKFFKFAIDANSYQIMNSTIPSNGNPCEQLTSVLDFTKHCLNLLGYDFFAKSIDLTSYTSSPPTFDDTKESIKPKINNHSIEISKDKYADLVSKNWKRIHPCVQTLLSQCDITFCKDSLTFASYHDDDGTNCFWADADVDFVNHKWTIILHNKAEKLLEVIYLEPNTLTVDQSAAEHLPLRFKNSKNSNVISLKITSSYIERQSQINFSPFITNRISYSVKDK